MRIFCCKLVRMIIQQGLAVLILGGLATGGALAAEAATMPIDLLGGQKGIKSVKSGSARFKTSASAPVQRRKTDIYVTKAEYAATPGIIGWNPMEVSRPDKVQCPWVLASCEVKMPDAKIGPPAILQSNERFCGAFQASLEEVRVQRLSVYLQDLEKRIEEKSRILALSIEEHERLSAQAKATRKKAEDAVADTYAKMKPEASAAQISSMADALAASILARLGPRQASVILNEMPAGRAARLSEAMAQVIQ